MRTRKTGAVQDGPVQGGPVQGGASLDRPTGEAGRDEGMSSPIATDASDRSERGSTGVDPMPESTWRKAATMPGLDADSMAADSADPGSATGEGDIPQTRGVGPQLRAAREKAGLTLAQVARETRISRRYLENIEAGEFIALPGRTYAIGFAKNYAKTVGLDQGDVAAMVGAELDAQAPARPARQPVFEPGDPARVPSRRLGFISLLAVVLLLAGLFFAARLMFAPAAELPSLVEQEEARQREAALAAAARQTTGPAQTAPSTQDPVVFTAQEDGIWVKFYDANGAQLMQKLMAEGESYTVPADVEKPQLWTGRPDALSITIGGRDVPPLAQEDKVMRDISVTADALLARGSGSTQDGGGAAVDGSGTNQGPSPAGST